MQNAPEIYTFITFALKTKLHAILTDNVLISSFLFFALRKSQCNSGR